MTNFTPIFSASLRSSLTLDERMHIARRVWPDEPFVKLFNRCADVADVELGLPVQSLSRREREAIEKALAGVKE